MFTVPLGGREFRTFTLAEILAPVLDPESNRIRSLERGRLFDPRTYLFRELNVHLENGAYAQLWGDGHYFASYSAIDPLRSGKYERLSPFVA